MQAARQHSEYRTQEQFTQRRRRIATRASGWSLIEMVLNLLEGLRREDKTRNAVMLNHC